MTPIDADELNRFYNEEHLEMLSKIPGWRRTLRYKLTKAEAGAASELGEYVAVHEYDHLDALQGPEAQAMRGTKWAKRMTGKDAKFMKVEAWERVSSNGF